MTIRGVPVDDKGVERQKQNPQNFYKKSVVGIDFLPITYIMFYAGRVKEVTMNRMLRRWAKRMLTVQMPKSITLIVMAMVILWMPPEVKAREDEEMKTIFKMSLEELMKMEVTSISKKAGLFHDSAASIYVLTEEDIRRSGAVRLTELLNMVPGAWFREVTWNFTYNGVRSPADEFPQSMLVLLDGVPIQTSITGGPMYNYIEIPVRQIQRIEVIKGPGGTIYGANANTGIISIFTREAADSDGLFTRLEGGLQDYMSSFTRYGKEVSKGLRLSGFASYSSTRGYDKTGAFKGDTLWVDGLAVGNKFVSDAADGRESVSMGLHVQADVSRRVKSSTRVFFSTVRSKSYTESLAHPEPWVIDDGGRECIGAQRFDVKFNGRHSFFVQSFFRSQSVEFASNGGYNPRFWTADLEIQDNLRLGDHELSFGGNYRVVRFDIKNNPAADLVYINPGATETLCGFFVRDKVRLGKAVDLTVGVKGEAWSLVGKGFEFSPSVRLAVKPVPGVIVWGAVSRSITIPGYFHHSMERLIFDLGPGMGLPSSSLYIGLVPGMEIRPTEYITCEFGGRAKVGDRFYFDVSGFYARIDNAIGLDMDFMSKPAVESRVGDYMLLPIYFTNIYKGKMFGGEAVVRFMAGNRFKAELSYSLYKVRGVEGLPVPGGGGAVYTPPSMPDPFTPEHIIRFRPYVDFPEAGIYLTFHMVWASKANKGQRYDYVNQVQDDNGVYMKGPGPLLKVDFNIEKRFSGGCLSVNLWGRNVLNRPYVEYYSAYFALGYPHTVHPVFGMGVSYRFPRKER